MLRQREVVNGKLRPKTQVTTPSSAEKPGNVAILVNNVNIEIHLNQNIQALGFKSGLTSTPEEGKEHGSFLTK